MRHGTFLRYVHPRLSSMKHRAALGAVALACGATVCTATAQETVTTRLHGYQETPQTINTAGSGEFKASIHEDRTAIDYELTYRNLSSSPAQAHIHFGRPALSGGVVLFLCTNGTPPANVPAPPACPAAPATVRGTLTAADLIPSAGQGIDPGAAGFAEILKAIGADAAYANVHTTLHPSGEIRGRLGHD